MLQDRRMSPENLSVERPRRTTTPDHHIGTTAVRELSARGKGTHFRIRIHSKTEKPPGWNLEYMCESAA